MQARVQDNLQRIKQYEDEAAMLEGSLSSSAATGNVVTSNLPKILSARTPPNLSLQSMQQLWYPVCFTHQLSTGGMATFDLFGQPWVIFRDAHGKASCVKDECAHRACPLSLVCARSPSCTFPPRL